MEDGLKKIRDLYQGRRIFRIPDYQRSYSWEIPHLQDLFDDLCNVAQDHHYFLGSILLFEAQEERGFSIVDVVDGQQRITSITLLIRSLLKRLGNDTAPGEELQVNMYEDTYLNAYGRPKLRLQEYDRAFFETAILSEKASPEEQLRTPSQKRLLDAKRFFDEQVEDLSSTEAHNLLDALETSNVLTYSVHHPVEAALIFETTNDRGKSLSNLEKVKSFFMYHQYLILEEPGGPVEDTQRQFAEMYRDADRIEEQEDAVLQYTFIGVGDWKSKRGDKQYQRYTQMIKGQVRSLGTTSDGEAVESYVSRFTIRLRNNFAALRNFPALDITALHDLYHLRRTANFLPLLLKCYNHDRSPEKSQFAKLADLCETFSFRVYGIGNKPINTGRPFLYRRARDFTGDWTKLFDALGRRILRRYSRDAEFERKLRQPRLYNEVGGRDLVYLFWKYENWLRREHQPFANPMAWQEIGSGTGRGKGTIEHIAPRNPSEGSKVVAKEAILPHQTEEFREEFLHSLGNLTFDPLSANASKGNKQFSEKLGGYFRRAPYKTQTELVDFLEDEQWTQQSIKRRADQIVRFALQTWDPRKIAPSSAPATHT